MSILATIVQAVFGTSGACIFLSFLDMNATSGVPKTNTSGEKVTFLKVQIVSAYSL